MGGLRFCSILHHSPTVVPEVNLFLAKSTSKTAVSKPVGEIALSAFDAGNRAALKISQLRHMDDGSLQHIEI
jgi:hypothetical protein